ncbi:MAG: S41 family peptidase [Candidatus Roizmanbacteria bacterium]|nr:S41 family peptidase [Candidatus Roizmanbacteria bacterium]
MKPEKTTNKLANVILGIAITLFLFGLGYRIGEFRARQNVTSSTAIPADFSLLQRVADILEEKYVNGTKIQKQQLVYGAIKGMVASLNDPYTFFMTPKENTASKDDLGGLYEGIGAQLGLRENQIIVATPLKNSPAERAGIRSGDAIMLVDGKATKGWTLAQAVNAIRGPHDSTVTLTLLRGLDTLKVPVKRERIVIEPVELSYKDDVAYIKVVQFGDQTNDLWDAAVADVASRYQEGSVRGMVLDVRSNPGGYLESAVYLASDFLEPGKLIVRQEYADKSGKDYTVTKQGSLLTIPLVVLVDEGSASAAEILAGALRDYKRAILVGRKTFGKGSVQEAIDLENGTGLHITVAKWILPKGDWINGKGIKPTKDVENKVNEGNTLTDDTDKQLQVAIDSL